MDFLSRFFRQKKKETTPKKARSSSRRREREGQLADDFKTFILEPILTPSALIDGGEDVPDATVLDGNDLPWLDSLDAIALEDVVSSEPFTSGTFEVGATGEVAIDFLYDGGSYEGELAIFSLEGMEEYEPGSPEFIQEAANRALSDTEWGHIVISDQEEGARFEGNLGEGNFNQGEHQGAKSFQMRAGDKFGIMLVPNGEVEQVFENPNIGGSNTPLFSLSTANPDDNLHLGQIADITGDGQTFVFEDVRFDSNWYDKDYNDIIFQVRGARGEAPDIDDVIADGKNWRDSDLGQEILEFADIESDFVPFSETEIEDIEIEDIEVANTQGSTEIAESEPIVVETIEISEVAVEEIATSPELIWEPAIAILEQQIEILQQQPEFSQQMQLTFGEDWTAEKLDVLLAELRTGEARPYIEIVSHAELGASGAYGVESNTIYLSQEFLTENWDKPELLQRVFIEEIGHYLDAQFNGEDSPGDEGEIFATWVLGGALSESQYAALKREDDRATRTLNGQILNLELNGSPATGLTAQYFRNQDLTDLVLTRIDPNINFDWGTNAPDPSYGNQSDVWSARWQGQIDVPHTDTYTFSSIADDGMRLWIDGELVIDNWDDGNGSSYTRSQDGAIALEAGQHEIKVEYRDQWWVAQAQLLWSSPLLGGQEVIPPEVFSPYEPPGTPSRRQWHGTAGRILQGYGITGTPLRADRRNLGFRLGNECPRPQLWQSKRCLERPMDGRDRGSLR